jgi:aspartate kinase
VALIVAKFGGTSVADLDRLKAAASKVAREAAAGHQLVVVVSAMAGVTNDLVSKCDTALNGCEAHPQAVADRDAVLASGEQVTAGLMALCLQSLGLKAKAYQGWQVPVQTDNSYSKARITDIPTAALTAELAQGIIPVVAGFQGISQEGRISTIGRGGSDTTAVALAASLKANRCDIYTDVDGIYTTDPRVEAKARKISRITLEEMLEMAAQGAKVLQTRSVEMAMRHGVLVQVLSSFEQAVGSDLPGSLLTQETEANTMESRIVTGIAFSRDEAQITLRRVPDRPGLAAGIFGPLAEAQVNVDMIVQDLSTDGKATDLSFTVTDREADKAAQVLRDLQSHLGFDSMEVARNVAKVSIVGVGMRSAPGVAATMFKTLSDKGINIRVIASSEIKITVLIDADATELAVRALHGAYNLDQAV